MGEPQEIADRVYMEPDGHRVREIVGEGPWPDLKDLPRIDTWPGYSRLSVFFEALGGGRSRFRIVDWEGKPGV